MQSMRPNNFAGKAERTTSVRNANRAGDTSARPKPKLAEVWPHAWRLIRPRRGLLALGFVLMIINRVCGLVLPASSKPFVDGVLTKPNGQHAAAHHCVRAERHPDPGVHFVCADAASLQGGAAHDRRPAAAGAGAHRAALRSASTTRIARASWCRAS